MKESTQWDLYFGGHNVTINQLLRQLEVKQFITEPIWANEVVGGSYERASKIRVSLRKDLFKKSPT
jgi:hypothetical protein